MWFFLRLMALAMASIIIIIYLFINTVNPWDLFYLFGLKYFIINHCRLVYWWAHYFWYSVMISIERVLHFFLTRSSVFVFYRTIGLLTLFSQYLRKITIPFPYFSCRKGFVRAPLRVFALFSVKNSFWSC